MFYELLLCFLSCFQTFQPWGYFMQYCIFWFYNIYVIKNLNIKEFILIFDNITFLFLFHVFCNFYFDEVRILNTHIIHNK